jgi:hypothetical protein
VNRYKKIKGLKQMGSAAARKMAADPMPIITQKQLQETGRRVIVSNSRRIIVIAKLRQFDEAAWKRLLVAYAYALYDRGKQQAKRAVQAGEGQHK